jgi:hypothetical protein
MSKEPQMSNPKAQAFIRELSRVLAKLKKSGLLAERVTAQEHKLLFKLTSQLKNAVDIMDEIPPVVRVDRLLLLADYLEKGKFKLEWDFTESTYWEDFPALFPGYWIKDESDQHLYGIKFIDRESNSTTLKLDALQGQKEFFGLTSAQDSHLFYYYNWQSEYGNVKLTERSSAKKMAACIRQFCDYINNQREAGV